MVEPIVVCVLRSACTATCKSQVAVEVAVVEIMVDVGGGGGGRGAWWWW